MKWIVLVTKIRLLFAICILMVTAAGAWFLLRHRRAARLAVSHVYTEPETCARCHAVEASGYARTGMAQAFSRPHGQDSVAAPAAAGGFYHAASGTYYKQVEHDGSYYQRRWQQGFDGRPENVQELLIDYVMGSGNHARTYLHRERDGTLIELPLGWYSEDGGHWGMNPGFDNPHPMTRRTVAYECMFCHNAYPQIPPTAHRDLSASPIYGAVLPEGIDCQRCHGPGAAHVKAAETPGTSPQQIRAQILNPARLSNDRQMEVCEQCHLETTSHLLPDRVRRYDQEPFGYRPEQPLSGFNAYFERDPGKGSTDNFEIVSAPYRLRRSQCYLKSQGALTCEICHNPHDLHKGREAASYYAAICLRCHAANLAAKIAQKQHTASEDCVSCHMPKRRTEDVVHAIMTDHLIQRRPPPAGQLLAERSETADTPANAYRGSVRRYLLDHESARPDDALYDAVAQVIDGSNLQGGVPALAELIRTEHPSQPNFSVELGDAMRHTGDPPGAIEAYRQAVKLDPLSARAQRRLGVALGSAGRIDEALTALQAATQRTPDNALLWYEQALVESRSGDLGRAIEGLRKAIELQPDFADAQNNLGSILAQSGDLRGAEDAFRAALTANPYDDATRANLGRLLASRGDWKQAAFHLQKAVQLENAQPSQAGTEAHVDYAVALLQLNRMAEAEAEATAAVRTTPESARAHDLLGEILIGNRELLRARMEFERALKLDGGFGPAQLDLGQLLLQQGQGRLALPLLQQAERSSNGAIAERARALLQQVPMP